MVWEFRKAKRVRPGICNITSTKEQERRVNAGEGGSQVRVSLLFSAIPLAVYELDYKVSGPVKGSTRILVDATFSDRMVM